MDISYLLKEHYPNRSIIPDIRVAEIIGDMELSNGKSTMYMLDNDGLYLFRKSDKLF